MQRIKVFCGCLHTKNDLTGMGRNTNGKTVRFRDNVTGTARHRQPGNDDMRRRVPLAKSLISDVLAKANIRHLADYNTKLEYLVQERTQQLTRANARLQEKIEDHLRDKEALSESEKKYACLMDSTLTGFYVIQDKRIVYCNRRFAEIFGYLQNDILHIEVQQLFPADDGHRNDGTDKPWMEEERIVEGVARDGRRIWLHRSLSRIDCLREMMTLGNVIDVTAQKKAETALKCLQCDKKLLSEKLLTAQESERKHIAAELHDSIGQSISAIKFSVENSLHECGASLPDSVNLALKNAVDKLRETIEEVRTISMDLRPPMLDDLGLLATISWFCREFKVRFPKLDMEVHTSVQEDEIPDSLKLVMFRILQETLNNIGKHAMAGKVSIELARNKDLLTLEINDDGRGFEAQDLPTGQGFGLGNMRERAKLSGGKLAIESEPGTGTLVRSDWPVGR